jgi:Protein of unknown function (DUF3768)
LPYITHLASYPSRQTSTDSFDEPISDAASSRKKSDAPAKSATERIRELNDKFRRNLQGGKVLVTAGVDALGPERVQAILKRVTEFNAFTPDNDPYGEHDFGNFEDGGERFFFKIDYYDEHLEHGSEDPADPDRTSRVLTVMLASEYKRPVRQGADRGARTLSPGRAGWALRIV